MGGTNNVDAANAAVVESTASTDATEVVEETASGAEQQAAGGKADMGESFMAKLEERYQKDFAAALAEMEKKAAMTTEEKDAYEKEQQIKVLAEREKAVAFKELKADAKDMMASKEIPADFLDMLVGADLKATEANMDAFKKQFDLAVQAQVEKRLVGKTPGTSTGVSGGSVGAAMAAEIDKYMN